jgi:hypothetical protein
MEDWSDDNLESLEFHFRSAFVPNLGFKVPCFPFPAMAPNGSTRMRSLQKTRLQESFANQWRPCLRGCRVVHELHGNSRAMIFGRRQR